MKLQDALLYPFALIYQAGSGIRNHLYNTGHKKSFVFQIPVVSVGNLNIGGSGKTPAIEYLLRLLKDKYQVATLSRGYGRRTKGLRFASPSDNAITIGDEPYQFYRNHSKDVHVVVGEDRAYAIPHILQEYPDCEVILLDDAFQHRSVNPHVNILLTDFNKPFYEDYLLPMGRLREARDEANRADIIIVTKCKPDLSEHEQDIIIKKIRKYVDDQPIFFADIKYGKPQPFQHTSNTLSHKVALLSGIAKSRPLEEYVSANFEMIKHFRFRDHHHFKTKEISAIAEFFKLHPGVSLLTTEKDMVRLLDSQFDSLLKPISSFFLPIEMNIMKNGAEFDNLVLNAVENVLDSSQSNHS